MWVQRLILLLNRLTPRDNSDILKAKRSLCSYARFEYQRAPSTIDTFGRHLELSGKKVLDLGCGLGGSEAYYLEQGAEQVYAIDLDLPRLQGANRCITYFVTNRVPGQIRFVCMDAKQMALPDDYFDLIISTNTFEHIFGVGAVLAECARILKPDGLLFISFPPYLSPWGAHLNNWIKFPWGQVFFSEKDLVQASRLLEKQQHLYQLIPPEIQLNLTQVDYVPHLNRMSIGQFEDFVNASPLHLVDKRYMPLGWRGQQPISRLVGFFNQNSALRDYLTSQAVYILQRP